MTSQQSLSFRGAMPDGSQSRADKGCFDFLGLSRELRDAIYELVLQDDCTDLTARLCDVKKEEKRRALPLDGEMPLIVRHWNISSQTQRFNATLQLKTNIQQERYRLTHSLLFVNRQIHEEYLQRAMQIVTFVIPFSTFDHDEKTEEPKISPFFAKNLKTLTFEIMEADLRWSKGEIHGNLEFSTQHTHQAFLRQAEDLLKTFSVTTLRFVMEYTMMLSNAIADTRIFLNRAEKLYNVERTEMILACPGATDVLPEKWLQFCDIHTTVLKLRGVAFEQGVDQDREILATIINPPGSFVTEYGPV